MVHQLSCWWRCLVFHVRVPGLETHLLPNSSYLLVKSLGSITDDSSSSMGHSRWKPGWNSWLLDLAWFRSGCCMLLEVKQGMEPFSTIIFLYPFQLSHFIYKKKMSLGTPGTPGLSSWLWASATSIIIALWGVNQLLGAHIHSPSLFFSLK